MRFHHVCIVFVLLTRTTQSQINVAQNSDPCIDMAREASYAPLQNLYSSFTYFTIALPTSRQLFRHMYAQTFTSASFMEYCRAYETGRSEYNRCPETQLKAAVLTGYRLADYICVNRLNDFATHLPCLQNVYQSANERCRSKCQQYEQESMSFLDSRSTNTDFLMNADSPHLAGDCKYLDCVVSCRRPLFEQQCGRQAADLDWQSLQVTSQSTQDLYDYHQYSGRNNYFYEINSQRNGQSPFPDSQRNVAMPPFGEPQNSGLTSFVESQRNGFPPFVDPLRNGLSPYTPRRSPNGMVTTFPVECRRLSERYVGYYSSNGRVRIDFAVIGMGLGLLAGWGWIWRL